jgi:hypothetical protein
MEKLILEEIQRMNLLSKYDNLKTLSEQANPVLDIAKEIHASVSGPGTNEEKLIYAIIKIKNAQEFSLVNSELKKMYSNLDVAGWINDDMGADNLETVKAISNHLKSKGVNNTYEITKGMDANRKPVDYFKNNSFKILATPAASTTADATTDPWAKYPCVVNHPNAKKTVDSSGGVVYLINGIYYYGNGRKMLANKTMGNYTCNDPEFKTAAAGGAAKNTKAPKTGVASVQSRVQKVQTQLGIEGGTGQLDMVTLQKMIDKLSATTPTKSATPATPATPATDNQQLAQLSQQINALNQAQA